MSFWALESKVFSIYRRFMDLTINRLMENITERWVDKEIINIWSHICVLALATFSKVVCQMETCLTVIIRPEQPPHYAASITGATETWWGCSDANRDHVKATQWWMSTLEKRETGRQAEIGDRQRSRGRQGGGETRTRAPAEKQEEAGGSGFTRLDFRAIFGGVSSAVLQRLLTMRREKRSGLCQ